MTEQELNLIADRVVEKLVPRTDAIQRERMKLATALGIGTVVFVMAGMYVLGELRIRN